MNRGVAALVHDWMVVEGGAERVLLELSQLLPEADVHTTFFEPGLMAGSFRSRRVETWPPQRISSLRRRFRAFLPLYPLWFGRLDLRHYDLVVSSSVAFTHAVRTRPDALHISYVYTPIRYAWDLDTYLSRSSWSRPAQLAARLVRPALRRWDRATAGRADVVVAISEVVRERIRRHWRRDAEVIYPPVDVNELAVSGRDDGFLLVASRLLAYRRLDLAVDAAAKLGRDLVVAGDGPELKRLQAGAPSNVRFVGHVDRPTLLDLFATCHAYVVPGEEDFGIAPVEAMAAGKPVIAYRGGGALETVVDGKTGVFFDRQSPEALIEAMERLDTLTFDPSVIRTNAERFDVSVFRRRFLELLERLGVDPALYVAESR